MYLKSLEIQGFKSFPDRVFVEFGQGITSIVGPNGSGKSNISDAVRWVLGEQSARILRGSKMEDIIFAGTELRKPMAFAEVSLTLDNSNKILPIDYNEVSITRRIYRSGESEFFINKSSCRLKDIHQLFMDTGLGKDGYSIIGQGRIDEILSSKSEERRMIFEEAAGITKYRYRKDEAEKKLEMTRQNIIRLKDIITELEFQIEPLKEQSEKARQYLSLKEKLKVLEINVCLDAIGNLKKSSNEINENFEILTSQLQLDQAKLQELEEALDSEYEIIKGYDEQIEVTRNKLQDTKTMIEKHKNDIIVLENNIKNNKEILKKIDEEFTYIEKKIALLNKERLEKESLLKHKTDKQTEVQGIISDLEIKNQQIHQFLESENSTIDSLKSEVIDKMNHISEAKVKVNSLKVLQNNFLDRKKSIDKELNQQKHHMQQLQETMNNMKEQYSTLVCDINHKKKQYQEYTQEIIGRRNNHKELSSQYSAFISSGKELMSRKTLLEEMERGYEGYNKSVKNVLQAWKHGRLEKVKIHGVLSKLVSVADKFTTAIEIALGSAMQNIVVETEHDAKAAIEYLKANQLGRATFLPISSVKGSMLEDRGGKISRCKGYQGIAVELIDFDSKYRGIMNQLLGKVVIVDHIDHAIDMAKEFSYRFRIVTLNGEVLSPGGSLSGGSINKVSSFLSRAKEIDKLQQQIAGIEQSKEETYKKIAEEEKQINNVERSHKSIEISLKEAEGCYISLESEIKHNESTHQRCMQTIAALLKENKQIEEQIENTESEIVRLLDDNKIKEVEIEKIKNRISSKHAAYQNEIAEKESINQQLMDQKIVLGSIYKDIDVLYERMDIIRNEIKEYENNKKDKNQGLLGLQKENESIQSSINSKINNIDALEQEMSLLQQDTQQYFSKKEQAQQNVNIHHSSIKQKRESISVLQNELYRIENKKIRVEMELENNINKLWDEYELTFSSAEEYKEEIGGIQQAQKQINIIKNEIRQLGNVNVNAIEEYKQVKERYEFLTVQRDDLEKAEMGLVKIINDMLLLMKKQFSEQFNIINESFGIVFNQLFGGGKAALRLSQPDNILESGIEIEVQPPGKKLQNIMLLSGGEKAFTAIALLFAILKVRPTPFSILDEIEAALDDANVYRFAQYLKNYSQQTQFIIVTHRRGTMESADILYGVTMQEKGISKLISLKMDEVAS